MMLTILLALAAASGQVVEAGPATALVRLPTPFAVGTRLTARRLEPAPGPPGRPPFFRTTLVTLRVIALRGDGTAEAALLSGRVIAGDRVEIAPR